MSITRHHNEWLSLVPNSGPFLSLPVLAQAFPQGLDAHDADHARRLRMAFGEWDDNLLGDRPDPGIHRAWMRFVLAETMGCDELLAEKQEIPQTLKSDVAEYGETLRPDWVVNDPASKKARLLVQVFPRSQSLTKPVASSRWKTSPDTRMMQLLHDTGIRLGLVTNGDHWMLVNAPKNETTGYASWYANLWLEEPVTLRAFRTLLSADRFFSVPDAETLDLKDGLLDQSQKDQQEVTDQLGYQVRKAVEVVIQALDKADQDHGRKLLADVEEKVLYESALTVMMRLVFLFCAEERELLLLGDELYDKNYAVSTLREQLRLTADEFGEEILGLRYDAWTRLLTTFRAVYAGAKHDRLKLPAYGGSLFNPDRFPFLEGRKPDTTWRTAEATPLPVSNRTVLHLLEALQVLQTKVGKTTEARTLSFRSLDIEQIGHVYEGLLDHTARRATEPVLGLAGTRNQEPEIALATLEKISAKGEKELLRFLKDETGRSESAIKKGLTAELDDQLVSRFRTACQDSALWMRVKPYAGLVRVDTVGYPVVITTGSVFVTAGTDRRSTGTHYTPKTLTEPIVQYTLEPLIYDGPSDGKPKDEWKLKSARELLGMKVCDIACGSGAFLVEACRYLAARLQEAWQELERQHPGQIRMTPEGLPSQGLVNDEFIPADPDEREAYARRLVAQRCIYGVDKNPLAVEIAKLSLWLLTLAKDKPFEFLDHAIRHGDSLVGLHDLEQLRNLTLTGEKRDGHLFLSRLDDAVNQAIVLRNKLESRHATSIEAIQEQERYFHEASALTTKLSQVADVLIATAFEGSDSDLMSASMSFQHGGDDDLAENASKANRERTPFHWPLEFPEVFVTKGGFDACIGNPPFMGGQKITGFLGTLYREYLVHHLAKGKRGSADLCAYFFLRAAQLVRPGAGFGLIASNTIAQGDTREVAFDLLLAANFIVNRAHSSRPWPGFASLEISIVWVRKGGWNGLYVLDEKPAEGITAYLTPPGATTGNPYSLKANQGKSFIGYYVLGMGFVLTTDEALALIAQDARNKDVLFPYLNGEDLNTRPDQSASRWVINFFDWPVEKAMEYPDCFRLIEEKVRSERLQNNRKVYRDYWWQYAEKRPAMIKAIAGLDRLMVVSLVSNKIPFAVVDADQVFAHKLAVFSLQGLEYFALIQSSFHYHWCWQYSSTMRTDLNYSPSDCFETFPFPQALGGLAAIGEQYHTLRSQIMLVRKEGLTKTYNRCHDPEEASTDIQRLRELHVEMDIAVAAAYGWSDLNLDHGFHETKQGVRCTISDAARREVLARLLTLNHERYADEVKRGLHDTKAKRTPAERKPKTATTKPALVSVTQPLFDLDTVDPVFPATEPEKVLCGLLCDLVAVQPGLSAIAYLDALVIALRPQRHGRLLVGTDRKEFITLADKLLTPQHRTAASIQWSLLRDTLTDEAAIRQGDGDALFRGDRHSEKRKAYPPCDAKMVRLLHKAAATLREYQDLDKPASTDGQESLAAFNEDKRTLCGALS